MIWLKWVNVMSAQIIFLLLIFSCSDDPEEDVPSNPTPPAPIPFNIDDITDTYPTLTSFDQRAKWGPYSTDAAYGITVPPGIQIRRSKDLVEWEFLGFAFDALPKQGADYIKANNTTPFNSLWAPYVLKVGSEFRLYYSLSSPKPRVSVIGIATATNPRGPWTEKGLVVTSKDDNTVQTNAIDPSVIITSAGDHWMYYGSAWDGIYILKLNA